MKLDNTSRAWINCRTPEEQDMILDIFECLGFTWSSGKSPRAIRSYGTPMHYLIEEKHIWHGNYSVGGANKSGSSVVEAKDFINQWKSLKKNLDK